MDAAAALTPLVYRLFHGPPPVRFEFWDGSAMGPATADATIHVRSSRALRRMATAPGGLGMARAYVAGDVDLEGDLDALLALGNLAPEIGMDRQPGGRSFGRGSRPARSPPDGPPRRRRSAAYAGDLTREPAMRPPSLTTTTCPTTSIASFWGPP